MTIIKHIFNHPSFENHSPCSHLFKLIYPKRKAVELSFSTLQNLNIENPTHLYLTSSVSLTLLNV